MQVVLVMFRPDGSRRSFSLARDLTIIGRGEDCDLRIPLGDVSRKHARLAKDGESLHLEDLGSSNGTHVNGERIQEVILNGGDVLNVGPLTFVVQINGFPADDDMTPPVESTAADAPAAQEALQADAQDVVELELAPSTEAEAPAEPPHVDNIHLEELEKAPPHVAPAAPPPPPLPPGVDRFEPVPAQAESASEESSIDLDSLDLVEDMPTDNAAADTPIDPPSPPLPPPVPSTKTNPASAVVLVSSARLPDIRGILAAAKSQLRGQPVPKAAAWREGELILPVGPSTITVSLIPAAYPWADLQGPATMSWWWPEAVEKLQPLQHHLVVAVAGGELDPIERRVLLTHIVHAVVKTTDAVGVHWVEGELVHEAARFLEQSADASIDNPPASLWVDVRIEQNEDDSYRCFTTGMARLGFMEIEVPQTTMEPGDLYTCASETVHSILSTRAHVPEGKTLGRPDGPRFLVSHAPSIYGRGTVLTLTPQ